MTHYFRFEDALEGSGSFDVDGDYIPGPSHLYLRLWAYPVIRRTPKGAWIDVHGEHRFVCDNWRKRYALPSIEEAKTSFLKRKERQASIYEARARDSREAITLMNRNHFRDFTKGLFA